MKQNKLPFFVNSDQRKDDCCSALVNLSWWISCDIDVNFLGKKIVSFTPKLHVLLLLLQTHIDQQHQFGTNNRVDHIQIPLAPTLQTSASRLHQVNVAKWS